MANPPVVACDTDALHQFLLARESSPLKTLKERYGTQVVIVDEVYSELRNLESRLKRRNFNKAKQVADFFKKLLENGQVKILDATSLSELKGLPRMTTWDEICTTAKKYHAIDTGEAYTWAASLCMGVPAISNDSNAIDTAFTNKLATPTPILRGFDLICLSYQCGRMSADACDNYRKELRAESEWIPRDFENSAFVPGLKSFIPRLTCASTKAIGQPNSGSGFAALVTLEPLVVSAE